MSDGKTSGFEPTPGQYKAINHRGHNVLVAASAGSGKTKVLIERVLKQVLEQGTDLSRMLIVTFTDAAAKEMRDRLTIELQKKLSELLSKPFTADKKQVSWIKQQLVKVNVADISTIHAFCLHLIQKYYYLVDIDPDFRLISDDTERTLIRDDVWSTVREHFYQQLEDADEIGSDMSEKQRQDAKSFGKLLQIFAKDRDDEDFSDLVMRADEFSSATSDPKRWLAGLSSSYELKDGQDFTSSKIWQGSLKGLIMEKLTTVLTDLKARNQLFTTQLRPEMENYWNNEIADDLKGYSKKKQDRLDKYAVKAHQQQTEVKNVEDLLAAVENDTSYTKLQELVQNCKLSATPTLMKRRSATAPNDLNARAVILNEKMKSYHDSANKKLSTNLLSDCFTAGPEKLAYLMHNSENLLIKFGEIVATFRQEYQREKKHRHLLDFNDLEHYALRIVSANTKESLQVKTMLQNRYKEIMVDEYQDTNGVQEALLSAIKNPRAGNMFMVGDVKQSIYRFRQADPALFNQKYQEYVAIDDGQSIAGAPGEKIILAENFRSVENVADLTNLVFRQLMDQKIGEISYDDNAALKAGNLSYPTETRHVSTDILIYESNESSEEGTDEEQSENYFEIDSKEEGQIYLVAHKIKRLIETEHASIFDRRSGTMRPLAYQDIAILASTHGDSLLIAEQFKSLGIPVNVDNTNNYFKTIEIQIMMSLLETIDNPHQDIPLVAVLRSPLYQFNENDLAMLRIQLKHGDFYQTLTDFRYQYEKRSPKKAELHNEQGEALYAKVTRFLDDLTSFRVRGRRNDLATLIWAIYTRTGFLDYAGGMPGGKQRQANLHALYQRAADYEKMSYKGIFQFVRFIKKMQEKDHDLAEMNVQDGNNAVSFMTIHKSKGLEFPVVFLINAHKKFNMRSISHKPYILDDKLGMGMDYVETINEAGRLIQVKDQTPVKLAIKEKATRKAIAEEMRKLYVALTRAEQKIYVVGESSDMVTALKNWTNLIDDGRVTLSDEGRTNSKANYLDWIGAAVVRSPAFGAKNIYRYSLNETGKPVTFTGPKLDADLNDEAKQMGGIRQKVTSLKSDAPEIIKGSKADVRIEFWDRQRLQYEVSDIEKVNQQNAHDWSKRQTQSGQLPPEYAALLTYKYPKEQLTLTTAYQSVTDIKRLFEDPDNESMGQIDVDRLGGSSESFEKQDPGQSVYLQHGFERPRFMTEEKDVTPTEIGTATHLIFQKLELDRPVTKKSVQTMVTALTEDGSISNALATKINIAGIIKLYRTKLGQEIIANRHKLRREAPIAMLYPVGKLFDQPSLRQIEQPVLIHGIIDGYFTAKNGTTVLFDYKTDHVPVRGEHKVAEKYRGQLNLYALALQSILGSGKPIEKYIYLVDTGEVVQL